jgi:hypothetical protein
VHSSESVLSESWAGVVGAKWASLEASVARRRRMVVVGKMLIGGHRSLGVVSGLGAMRCQLAGPGALGTVIHPSAWKGDSPKFIHNIA